MEDEIPAGEKERKVEKKYFKKVRKNRKVEEKMAKEKVRKKKEK